MATSAIRHPALLTIPAVTGVAYTLSWIAGLSVEAPSPKLSATGTEIVQEFAGHGGAVAVQLALTEGLPALGLAIVSLALARSTRKAGAVTAAWFAGVAGVVAAIISLTQFVLGQFLAGATGPGTAHLLFEMVSRGDGVKMFALGVLGAACAASGLLPRWLKYVGIALAAAIFSSGIAYLLMVQSLAILAYVSLPLLLIFITGTGIVLGRTRR
jgi:hypothetical protein